MRVVVQRVRSAAVLVGAETVAAIGPGLVALVGVCRDDGPEDVAWTVHKLAGLRLFDDGSGHLGRDLKAAGGALLLVSQITLCAEVRRGRRPDLGSAAPPDTARPWFERLVEQMQAELPGVAVATGQFGAHMLVRLENDGPVTIWLDSRRG